MPLKVKVILEGDNSLPELGGKTDEAELYALTVLPAGMGSGAPSVGIVSKLSGGNFICMFLEKRFHVIHYFFTGHSC